MVDYIRDLDEVVRLDGEADYLRAMERALSYIRQHHAAIRRDAEDAKLGRIVWKFIDRMTDVAPPEDSAEVILADFVAACRPIMSAAIASHWQPLPEPPSSAEENENG